MWQAVLFNHAKSGYLDMPEKGGAPELTEEALRTELKLRLPAFKHPKWVEIRRSLPKNQSGKILKSQLAEQEAGRTPLQG